MKRLSELYQLKDGYAKPQVYLGMGLQEIDGCWILSAGRYIELVLEDVRKKRAIPTNGPTPMKGGCRPDLDKSRLLDSDDRVVFQGLVGILR
jgi:hypothetical protein